MKIFHFTTDEFDYDCFDGFVVVAKDKEQAKQVITAKIGEFCPGLDAFTVTEVDTSEAKVILESFNAG